MDFNEKTAELLLPGIDKTPDYYENLYPQRALKEGARVTRFAPSPTGYLHLGGLFGAAADKLTAMSSGGIFILRIEDTDKKREIEDGITGIIDGLNAFGVTPDEGVISKSEEIGNYGPYIQSKRKEIYQCYVKELIRQGKAYPCFCSPEELDEIRSKQENLGINKGYYGEFAKCRNLSFEEIEEKVNAGVPYVIRYKSEGIQDKKCFFDDIIRGKIEMQENTQDIVLLKTDGIPTYHFAHVVDDHLMRTTHVIRGDEWIASTPIHLQLFTACGFKPPKYAHTAAVMKEENGGKRKLSKRKDPEAAVSYFIEKGYPFECVTEYLLTLLNSNFEDWRKANKNAAQTDFPFNLKKMSVSGALFDINKLNDISKNIIAFMDAETVYKRTLEWAKKYDLSFADLMLNNPQKIKAMLNLDRGGKNPRKDIAKWDEVKDYFSYFFPQYYVKNYSLPDNILKEDASKIITKYIEIYSQNDDKQVWFDKIKSICEPLGYTSNVKEYKQNPEEYKGHVGDVSNVIRIAVTSRSNTPDLYTIMQILGYDEVITRLKEALTIFENN